MSTTPVGPPFSCPEAEYEALVARGLSPHEAAETVWSSSKTLTFQLHFKTPLIQDAEDMAQAVYDALCEGLEDVGYDNIRLLISFVPGSGAWVE